MTFSTSAFRYLLAFLIVVSVAACSTSGPAGLFGKRSPHEVYGDKINDAGLKQTAMGSKWFAAAATSLAKPVKIKIPYSETGYFSSADVTAAGLQFTAKRGQKLTIELTKNPQQNFAVYVDLFQASAANTQEPKHLASADTSNTPFEHEVKADGDYILRLQPELLQAGSYTLSISIGPSLAFPVSGKAKSNIASFWGANRDNGERKHEGIDIFAPRRTPLVAAAPGVVTRVDQNNLGGKVVMMRPQGADYTLYYAHLDEQIATTGERVNTGDTLGLVGNTGNAATTSPHLHFGIYTFGGAIDPLPFVDPDEKKPAPIKASPKLLNDYALVNRQIKLIVENDPGRQVNLAANTVVFVAAASGNQYKVLVPGGDEGYIASSSIKPLERIRTLKLSSAQAINNAPATEAPTIKTLKQGDEVEVLGMFNNFYYVRKEGLPNGWIAK